MKRILLMACVMAMILSGCVPALAADTEHSYYPISVEEYTEGSPEEYRIEKAYQLRLTDDPSEIPTEDFERYGCTFHLLDMTRRDDIGVDRKPCVETVTKASDTDNMEKVLQALDAEIDVTTEDGYAGTLRLDHTTVQVSADGYATRTRSLSATRTYPNLSDADVSLIPKSIQENGRTLTLEDVQWDEAYQTEADGAVVRYCATASYTGTASSKYATGYTVTADYSGEVAKTGSDVVTYTAIFGVVDAPKETPQSVEPVAAAETEDTAVTRSGPAIPQPVWIGAGVVILLAGGAFAYTKIRERK